MSGGGQGGSNLPLYGTPEQQIADPLHLFPGAPAPSTVPTTLANLGSYNIAPQKPQGAFQRVQPQGSGQFNAMAAQSAGPLFNPAIQNPVNAKRIGTPTPTITPANSVSPSGAKGGSGMGGLFNSLPGIGGGNGKLATGMLTGGASNALGALGGMF